MKQRYRSWLSVCFTNKSGIKYLIIHLHFGNNKFIIARRFGDDESYDLKAVTESRRLVRAGTAEESFHFRSRW